MGRQILLVAAPVVNARLAGLAAREAGGHEAH